MSPWKAQRGAKPWQELNETANLLYYGRRDDPGGAGEPTLFRAAVTAGVVLQVDPATGFAGPVAYGAFRGSTDFPEAGLMLAAKLREMADEIEAKVRSGL